MNNSLSKIIVVSTLVSLVCAVLISVAAVMLKPAQQQNILIDKQKNILQAAGLYDANVSISEQFKKITAYAINLENGTVNQAIDAENYDPLKAVKIIDGDYSSDFETLGIEDKAKIGRLEKHGIAYLVHQNSQLNKIIIPVRGYGLWSTLYGFLALESDATTIAGIGFYKHGETPGLGGEIDNPKWKSLWIGKKLFKGNELAFQVIKGIVPENSKEKDYRVDGLAGATLTARGVNNLIQFWLSKNGYRPFLENIKNGKI